MKFSGSCKGSVNELRYKCLGIGLARARVTSEVLGGDRVDLDGFRVPCPTNGVPVLAKRWMALATVYAATSGSFLQQDLLGGLMSIFFPEPDKTPGAWVPGSVKVERRATPRTSRESSPVPARIPLEHSPRHNLKLDGRRIWRTRSACASVRASESITGRHIRSAREDKRKALKCCNTSRPDPRFLASSARIIHCKGFICDLVGANEPRKAS